MSNTEALIARLHEIADKFSEGWHDGLRVDASDVVDLCEAADALTAQAATIAEQAAQIEAAIPAMREYARKNPKHHFSADGVEQDPNGAHAWLARNDAAMQSGKAAEPDATKCRKCNGNMRPGTYLEQTFSGVPDFPGDTHAVTVSPAGPGRLAECLKCDACGHSVTAGKAVQG